MNIRILCSYRHNHSIITHQLRASHHSDDVQPGEYDGGRVAHLRDERIGRLGKIKDQEIKGGMSVGWSSDKNQRTKHERNENQSGIDQSSSEMLRTMCKSLDGTAAWLLDAQGTRSKDQRSTLTEAMTM